MDYTPYLFPLTAIFLSVALAVLAWQSRRTGKFEALILGVAASILVLAGKFHAESDWITNGGIVLLVAAIFFGSRVKSIPVISCPACFTGGIEKSIQTR